MVAKLGSLRAGRRRGVAAIVVLAWAAASQAGATQAGATQAGATPVGATGAGAGAAVDGYDLTALLDRAAAENPEIAAGRARWAAMRSQSAVAGRPPEPMVSGGVFLRPVETRVGPQRGRLGVSVPVPWPSKLEARAEAMAAEATVAQRRIDARIASLRAQIRRPWARRAYLVAVAAILDEQRDLLGRLEPSLRTRLSVGKASFADAQRLRLAIETLGEQAVAARDEVPAVDAQLRALANLGPDAPLAPAALEADPLAGRAVPGLAALRSALDAEPEVRVAEAAISAARAGKAAARTRTRPDFAFALDWVMVGDARMQGVDGSGNDALMLGASVTLPVWRHGYDAETDAAGAREREAEAMRTVALRQAEARAEELLTTLRDARRKHQLYTTTLIPVARSALQTVVQAYASGGADFQSVIELQRQLLGYQLALLTAERRRVEAQADLEALLARPLTGVSP